MSLRKIEMLRLVVVLVLGTALLSIALLFTTTTSFASLSTSSASTHLLTVGILHVSAGESKGLARLLRRLSNARTSIHVIVINGSGEELQLNATAPITTIHVVDVGGRTPSGLASCYAHLLNVVADSSRFLAVVAADDLDRVRDDVLPDLARLVDWLTYAEKHELASQRVLLFAPSRVQRFATFSAALRPDVGALADPDIALSLRNRFANNSLRFQLEPIPASEAHLIHEPCRNDTPIANQTSALVGGVICSPVSWVSPRFGFLARTDTLRALPPQRAIVWDLLRESLALQWFNQNFSVLFCSNLHADQCHADIGDGSLLDDVLDTKLLKSVSNVSALALCAERPDVGSLVFDRWAVDCNVGAACTNGAKIRSRLQPHERGATTCADDSLVRALYKRGPRLPTLIGCEQMRELHQKLLANRTQPFARGAHKAVFEASLRDLPFVIKQVFFASAERPSSSSSDGEDLESDDQRARKRRKGNGDGAVEDEEDDPVASFIKTFERQVLDEFFYTNRWAPNPLRDNPFVMQIYGLCVGGSENETQLMAAEGPLLPWSAAAKSNELPWFARLAIAINLTRTIDFLHRQHVVLCGLNMEQVAIDNNFNAKVIDLDTLIETNYLSRSRLGEGMQCTENSACMRVPAVRMTPYAIDDLPERAKETTNRKGLILYFKEPRQGSRGSARHRTCLPKAPVCHCNSTNLCVGFDGATMLAGALDSMLRPLFDRSRYTASREFYTAIDQAFVQLKPGSCVSPRVAASDGTAVLSEVARQFGAHELMQTHWHEMQQLQARLLNQFIVTHRAKCENRGEFTKCAA